MIEGKTRPVYAMTILDAYRSHLSVQEYRTMRGQIEAGAPDAALKGLRRLLNRRGIKNEHDDI